MVLGHQAVFHMGVGPKPEGSFSEQILHAEATNLQLSVGMALGHDLTGGRLQSLEGVWIFLFPHFLLPRGRGAGEGGAPRHGNRNSLQREIKFAGLKKAPHSDGGEKGMNREQGDSFDESNPVREEILRSLKEGTNPNVGSRLAFALKLLEWVKGADLSSR